MMVFHGRSRARCRDYMSHLDWEILGRLQEELESVTRERDSGIDRLACCHQDTIPDKPKTMESRVHIVFEIIAGHFLNVTS